MDHYENWFWELVVVVIVAFVFIGPDQLPVYAKKIGKMLRELKKYTGAASEEIQKNVVEPLNEIQAPLKGGRCSADRYQEGHRQQREGRDQGLYRHRQDQQGKRPPRRLPRRKRSPI